MMNIVKNSKSRGVVLGIGFLGTSALIGISQPASAQSRAEQREERRELKQARKEVRKEQRDVAKADTRRERRAEKQELHNAKQNLRSERRDGRQQRWENNGRWNSGRYNEPRRDVNRDGVYDHKDAYIIGQRREGQGYNRRYNEPQRDVNGDGIYDHKDAYIIGQRRDYNGRYDYRRNGVNTRRDFRTEEGIVVNDLSGNAFVLRTLDGQQLRVQVPGGEPTRISRGDRVRVHGFFSNGAFRAQNLTILRNR
jgi:hypothetical protein